MTVSEIFRDLLAKQEISQTDFAKSMGKPGQWVVDRLRRPDPHLSTVIEMLDHLGYEIALEPKKPGRRKDGIYVIDSAGKKGE